MTEDEILYDLVVVAYHQHIVRRATNPQVGVEDLSKDEDAVRSMIARKEASLADPLEQARLRAAMRGGRTDEEEEHHTRPIHIRLRTSLETP
jgi:hypothetical protein